MGRLWKFIDLRNYNEPCCLELFTIGFVYVLAYCVCCLVLCFGGVMCCWGWGYYVFYSVYV